MQILAEHSYHELMKREDAFITLQNIFGKDIDVVFRNPKDNDDLLVRADLKNMAINASTGTRNHIVKISDTDRKEETTTTSQLIYCLGPVMMKTIASGDKIDLYIQTGEAIAQIQSPLSDEKIQSLLQHREDKFGQSLTDSLSKLSDADIMELKEFLGLEKNPSVLADVNGVFIRPNIDALRNQKRMDSIHADPKLNNPLSKSYTSIMLSPGSYIFPIYTTGTDSSVHSQLAVHAQTVIGG